MCGSDKALTSIKDPWSSVLLHVLILSIQSCGQPRRAGTGYDVRAITLHRTSGSQGQPGLHPAQVQVSCFLLLMHLNTEGSACTYVPPYLAATVDNH